MNTLLANADIRFRIQHLDKMQAYTLERELVGASAEKEADNNSYTGYIPLSIENFDDINDYYVRQQINLDACDIFIIINAKADTSSIELPAIVNKMLKYIDCKLTCSFSSND